MKITSGMSKDIILQQSMMKNLLHGTSSMENIFFPSQLYVFYLYLIFKKEVQHLSKET